MTGYKLFRLRKDGSLGPLFINRKQRIPVGEWLASECHPTSGYAVRSGWHILARSHAPHLSKQGRVWAEVEFAGYDPAGFRRPESQGGLWYLASWMRVTRVLGGGHAAV